MRVLLTSVIPVKTCRSVLTYIRPNTVVDQNQRNNKVGNPLNVRNPEGTLDRDRYQERILQGKKILLRPGHPESICWWEQLHGGLNEMVKVCTSGEAKREASLYKPYLLIYSKRGCIAIIYSRIHRWPFWQKRCLSFLGCKLFLMLRTICVVHSS